jgi:hypothetical protein
VSGFFKLRDNVRGCAGAGVKVGLYIANGGRAMFCQKAQDSGVAGPDTIAVHLAVMLAQMTVNEQELVQNGASQLVFWSIHC